MARKAQRLAGCDEPLRRVILVPLDGVSVVHGELVVKVMVAFADGDESGEEVVAGRVLVVKRCLSKPMRE